MKSTPRTLLLAAVIGLALARPAGAYIEVAMSFGAVIAQSTNVLLLRVEAVDREKNLIIYRKVQDIKGKHPNDVVKHNIGKAGLRPDEWKPPMQWAEPGKLAVMFYNGGASETCIGNWWYQAYSGGEWWNHSHGEPFLLRSYTGPPEKLVGIVTQVMAGQEVVVPCMVDGNKEDLHHRRAKVQRLKVSLKLQDYNPKRDFVGWGGDDFRRVQGMPGFTHVSGLSRSDPEAQAVSVADFDADGKLDLCLVGGGRVALLQNGGEALGEASLPGVAGARSAVWADYNADGRPDLLLTTPGGPRLLTNLATGFRDDSHVLPAGATSNLTAAAWLDYDADGRPDLLLASGYRELRLYRNLGAKAPDAPAEPKLGPWHVLGPLDNPGGQAFDAPHPVDKQVVLSAEYDGVNKQKVRWQRRDFQDGQVNNLRIFNQNENAACYLFREIDVAAPTDLPISLGSDDTLGVWLNGDKVLANNTQRAAAPDQDRALLKLKAGKNQLLLKVCQGSGDWAFAFAAGKPQVSTAQGLAFEDVSGKVGLGPAGAGAGLKGDSLTVCDVDGDGSADFLFGAGTGVLVRGGKNAQGEPAFSEAKDAGIAFAPGKVNPAFGDFDGDGHPDLIVPQKGSVKLFRNDGKGRFADVTAKAGDLAKVEAWATSAAWGDVDNDGRIDLVLGCLRGANRCLLNRGDGTFADATEALGLTQKWYNTQAVGLLDLNGDGNLDMVFNNEGQESVVLLGAPASGKRVPVLLSLGFKQGVVGGRVEVRDAEGKLVAAHQVSGGDGRGGQQSPHARFALDAGTYRVVVRLSSGQAHASELTVADSPIRQVIGEPVPAKTASGQ